MLLYLEGQFGLRIELILLQTH